MLLRFLIKDKHKRERTAHIVAGLIILLHSYENYDSRHGLWLFFLIAGIIFLTIAAFHPLLAKKFPWIDGVFFAIEGVLSVMVAIDFFHLGKKALPYAYLVAAVFQFVSAIIKSRKGMAKHKNAEAAK